MKPAQPWKHGHWATVRCAPAPSKTDPNARTGHRRSRSSRPPWILCIAKLRSFKKGQMSVVVTICQLYIYIYMGVSENSVPLNPMVNDHYPYEKWLFHWEYTLFSDKPIYIYICSWEILHQLDWSKNFLVAAGAVSPSWPWKVRAKCAMLRGKLDESWI